MAFSFEKSTGDIVINGFEEGIADSPYEGISDMRNINLISIPKEGSVNFSTSQISPPSIATGSVSSADAGTYYATYTGASGLENRMAIVFSAQSGLGVSTGVIYWIKNLGGAGVGTFQVTSDYAQSVTVHLTNGTGTFSIAKVGTNPITGATGKPLYFTYDGSDSKYFMQDATGAVWTNLFTTTSGYWTYLGPSGTADTNAGNGLVYYQASDGTRWVFAFNNTTIDYFDIVNLSWTYGWKPSTGGTHQTNYLKASGIHQAQVMPDNKVYYCDGQYIGRWYQADPTVPFVPTTPATYVFDTNQILPFTDVAQCLCASGSGTNIYIGGKQNLIYVWDTFSPLPLYPIYVAESNIVQLVTVNTNTFIFVGNRGRVYITNGSQAQLYKKIPDHISGTVEPYYTWGGATSNKNQIYFSALVVQNDGTGISQYGGVWAIDLDTRALRLTNKLSYGTYAGYASALIANFGSNPAGTGLYIGWQSGTPTWGIDTTISTPYTGGQAIIDSDLIPIGTYLKPNTNGRAEFKLAVPLTSTESVQLMYRQKLSDSFTAIGDAISLATSSFNGYSWAYTNVPFQNSQWVQIRAILTSTSDSPSYCRLTEIRLGN